MPTNFSPAAGEAMANADRAAHVVDYLDDYMDLSGLGDDDLDSAISDVVTDLLHLARAKGFDVDVIIGQARAQLAGELLEFPDQR